jgi:uncharacterized protein (TIGR03905 family)
MIRRTVMDIFEVTRIGESVEGDLRRASFQTCGYVCSVRIDIETEGDVIRRVRYTGGCHGNTQGVAALCAGMKVEEAIARLEGIDCKGRGTSCPDQLARALKQMRQA